MSKPQLPSNKNFGIVFAAVFLIIGFYPLIIGESIYIWSLIISITFLLLGLTQSKILTPLNKIWFKFGLLLGKIVAPIVMGIVFFFVVTPTGIIMRIFRKDVLNLKKNENNSYWIEKTGPKSIMKNQF